MTPFTDGYVEALRGALPESARQAPLADETLARIIADCAVLATWHGDWTAEAGQRVWALRQQGTYAPQLPPLTVTLGDGGKVRLSSEASPPACERSEQAAPATDEQPCPPTR